MNIIQKMKMYEPQYTNKEYKVYYVIIHKPALVDQYSITGIAAMASTSTSAVQRFCQKLGYQGYKDFRFDMIQYLQSENKETDKYSLNPLGKMTNIISQAIAEIRDIDADIWKHLPEDILSAPVVYTMGLHRSFLPAEKLRINLEDFGLISLSARDQVSFSHQFYCMDENSTIIIFSVSGHTYYYQKIVESVAQIAPKIWLITTNPCAPLKNLIKNVVVLPTCSYQDDYLLDDHAIMMAFVELISYFVLKEKQKKQTEKTGD